MTSSNYSINAIRKRHIPLRALKVPNRRISCNFSKWLISVLPERLSGCGALHKNLKQPLKKLYLFSLLLCILNQSLISTLKACPGRFVNPITDICWSCFFPLSIGPVKVNTGGREDTPNPSSLPCFCPRPPLPGTWPGIPVGFWEPARLVDVTRRPFCMVNMGGLSLGGGNITHYGGHG